MDHVFDLSQPIESGMTIFPGDPPVELRPAEGAVEPWKVSDLHIGTHTGTHIDAASHYYPWGNPIDQYPPGRFILPGILLPLTGLEDDHAITAQEIAGGLENLPEGGAVVLYTGWDQYWKSERYFRHPFLSPEACRRLVEGKASLVGIDALNVDSTVQATDHVHRMLLEKDILIVENLARLGQLQVGRPYQFSFLPLRWKGLDGSPIRAVAW